jgi:N-acetylglucosaminyldiphosphoundecaprenol N-acetyl-beta-D-mannosaminyltransferase
VYFLGSDDSTVKLVHKKLTSRHVGLKVAGFNHGFFPQTESRQQAAKIESSGASILFVAMGYPRQETFISDNWAHLGVNLAIPVGGSFDVIAGKRIRAPQALQNAGMEWLFRLIQEPRRLLFRYVITNTKFIWCSIRGILAGDVGN